MRRVSIFAVCALMLTGCGAFKSDHSTDTPPRYTVEELGIPGGGANNINDSGQVIVTNGEFIGVPVPCAFRSPECEVRCGGEEPPRKSFLWRDGDITDLGTLSGYSLAYGINDHGQVVGNSDWHAFLWEDGAMTDLGTLGGLHSEARAINDSGQIVGSAYTADEKRRAFIWQDGEMTSIGVLSGHLASHANDINDAGQVVGWSSSQDAWTGVRAFIWDEGKMTDLGSLGGDYTEAYAVNDDGWVVGESKTEDGNSCAFLYRFGRMMDIGVLPGCVQSGARDINNSGLVVGSSVAPGSYEEDRRAFLWKNGVMYDLNSLIPEDSGWVLLEARSINDDGQIVGMGSFDHNARAFILTPEQ